MSEIHLSALVGTDPLGFLAALGVLRLTADHLDPEARLAWDRQWATAVLDSRYDSPRQVAEALHEIACSILEGAVLPGVGAEFPQPGAQKGGDPMRIPRDQYRAVARHVAEQHGDQAARWLEHLVTDLGVDDRGRSGLSPWMAPSGKQTVHTFLAKSAELVRSNQDWLTDALQHWRRHLDCTGEYLDHRVINDAAADPSGKSIEAGIPGATWLAIMAMPLLRVSGDGTQVSGTLWHRVGRQSLAVWPLWHRPLTCEAVVALLEHPSLAPHGDPPAVQLGPVKALGVFEVCAAQRRPIAGRKFAGVLTPAFLTIRIP